MIRVSIVEDHRATREGFLKLLSRAPGILCLCACENAEQAEIEIPKNPPDVVLMDINLSGRNGIDCVAKLKRLHPKIEFVMLTTYDDTELIYSALRAGASGYLLKRAKLDEILSAIQDVHNGGSPMSIEIARRVVLSFREKTSSGEVEALSNREQEILAELAKGLPYKQIADMLGISANTVHSHLRKIYGKLHVQSRTEAVVKFLRK